MTLRFLKSKENIELNMNKLIEDFSRLKETEINIWKSHKDSNFENLLTISKSRKIEIETLKKFFDIFKNDERIINKFNNKKEIFSNIEKNLELLINLLEKQFLELNKSIILINEELREEVLNGNKINSFETEFTTRFNEIERNFIKLVEDEIIIEKKLEEYIKELEFSKLIKTSFNGRFKVFENTIYDTLTKIIWERDLAKSNKLKWDLAYKYCEKENKKLPSKEDWWNLNNEIGTWKKNNNYSKGYPNETILNEIGFLNYKIAWFQWTGNETNDKNSAWLINLCSGEDYENIKNGLSYVTPINKK